MLYIPLRGIELAFNTGFVPSRTRKYDIWTCFVVWDPLLMCTQLLAPASQKIVSKPQVSSIAYSSIISSFFHFTFCFITSVRTSFQFLNSFPYLISFRPHLFHFFNWLHLLNLFLFPNFFNFHTYHTGNIHSI